MVGIVISSVIGGLLLIAGVPKVRDRAAMLRVVRGYRVLPAVLGRLVAVGWPYTEIAVGSLLVTGLVARPAAAAASLLFLVFFAGLAINLLRGRRDLDCGCFSFASR